MLLELPGSLEEERNPAIRVTTLQFNSVKINFNFNFNLNIRPLPATKHSGDMPTTGPTQFPEMLPVLFQGRVFCCPLKHQRSSPHLSLMHPIRTQGGTKLGGSVKEKGNRKRHGKDHGRNRQSYSTRRSRGYESRREQLSVRIEAPAS